jgi:hypothetical protein
MASAGPELTSVDITAMLQLGRHAPTKRSIIDED